MLKAIKLYFWPFIIFAGTIASILSLAIIGVDKAWQVNLVLMLICLFVVTLFLRALSILNSFLKLNHPKGYIVDSVFTRYCTKDGNFIDYEVIRYIQCKQPLMDEIEYGFHWSGTHEPDIRSDVQRVDRVVKNADGHYDRLILKFNTPLKYNDCETLHIAMKLDDSDNKSQPYLEYRAIAPLKLLVYKIELQHKDAAYQGKAKVTRKKISGEYNHPVEYIQTIPFDRHSKSYHWQKSRPEPGYFYRIDWDK